MEKKDKTMNRKRLSTLHDGLADILSGMYDAESRIRTSLRHYSAIASDEALKKELQQYGEIASSKLIKLERIFNYLMQDPSPRSNEVITALLSETERISKEASADRLRDVLLTGSLQALNHYKKTVYNTARLMAVELEIETVTDLLVEIVDWEKQACKRLREIAFEEVTKKTPEITR